MSEKTWMREFYPVGADALKPNATDVRLLHHSIKKWRGALPSNLKRHDLAYPPIEFDAETCALCERYINGPGCPGCPLYEYRRGVTCAHAIPSEDDSPYHEWVKYNNPRPMLKLLRAALRKARAK